MDSQIEFIWKGYFKAPNKNWVHISREVDSYEIFCVTKGELYISDDENDYTVHAGEYVITPPCRNQHGWRASLCEFYYFHFHADGAGEDFPPQGACRDMDVIEKYYSLLSHNREQQSVHNHILAAILLELKNGGSGDTQDNISAVCRSIQTYVKFAQPGQLQIPLLAEKFQYNAKYLSQSFKKETGISLKKYLKEESMHRAKHMLANTGLSVMEISEQMGYSDMHSFSHVFRNAEGVSPRQYRAQMRQEQNRNQDGKVREETQNQ